jgi:hypothetical protein
LPTSQQPKTFFVSNTNNNPARELIFVGSVDNRRAKKSKSAFVWPRLHHICLWHATIRPKPATFERSVIRVLVLVPTDFRPEPGVGAALS